MRNSRHLPSPRESPAEGHDRYRYEGRQPRCQHPATAAPCAGRFPCRIPDRRLRRRGSWVHLPLLDGGAQKLCLACKSGLPERTCRMDTRRSSTSTFTRASQTRLKTPWTPEESSEMRRSSTFITRQVLLIE